MERYNPSSLYQILMGYAVTAKALVKYDKFFHSWN